MSTTPRTDAEERKFQFDTFDDNTYVVHSDFCRDLELELNEAKDKLAKQTLACELADRIIKSQQEIIAKYNINHARLIVPKPTCEQSVNGKTNMTKLLITCNILLTLALCIVMNSIAKLSKIDAGLIELHKKTGNNIDQIIDILDIISHK